MVTPLLESIYGGFSNFIIDKSTTIISSLSCFFGYVNVALSWVLGQKIFRKNWRESQEVRNHEDKYQSLNILMVLNGILNAKLPLL